MVLSERKPVDQLTVTDERTGKTYVIPCVITFELYVRNGPGRGTLIMPFTPLESSIMPFRLLRSSR